MPDLIVPQSAHPAGDLPVVVEAVADGPLAVDTIILSNKLHSRSGLVPLNH